MNKLPVIESCDGCGACCFEQESPPGYAMLLNSPEMLQEAAGSDEFGADVERLTILPDEAMNELRIYLKKLLNGETDADSPCIWFDLDTRKCRFHEYRPSTCREFEIGGDDCKDWRHSYGID